MQFLRTTVVAAAFVLGCQSEEFDAPEVTYHRDVAPIVQRSCQGCHTADGIAPFALTTYDEVRPMSARVADATAARTMPPWGAVETADCQPRHGFKNDIRLSDDEIDMLSEWDEAGAPEGDPDDAEPIDPKPIELSGAEQEIAPIQPYVTSGTTDQFRCFVMDPGVSQLKWVNGSYVIPGNREVVHHAVVFTDPTRASAALADASGSYDCFGNVGVPEGQLIAVWTPGQEPFELPSNVGTPIQPGSLLVMQIHYHPVGPPADPDLTKVQLRFNDTTPDFFLAPSTPIGNFPTALPGGDGLLTGPDFKIPAYADNHVETMQITIPSTTAEGAPLPDVWIYGAAAHMHYIGVDATITVERANGDRECLLHDRWDFNWQRIYSYDATLDELPMLSAGDKIKVNCVYDNTLDNPGVVRTLADEGLPAPIDVFLGEETTNEMCLALLPLMARLPAQ